ncbi:MAG: outer membrane protein transport protein [Verrucomicrobiota bacterium JB023]|nr:outer membrane protein transport protein [Verrucomicrobiota bacterium JB023]
MSPSLEGAGFQLAERSASGLGRAFSGEAAIADDASVIASNPAAMILLGGGWDYSISASYIRPSVDVSGVATAPASAGGVALSPAKDKSVIDQAVVPSVYLSKRLSDDWVAGLGVYTTYGLKTDYSDNFANLAATDHSELLSFNINPAVAWRMNDQFSFGGGIDFFYGEGTLNSAGPLALRLPPSPLPVGNFLNLEGDDWAVGFNVGLLWEVTDRTRIGVHYRSPIELNLEGHADVGGAFSVIGASLPTPVSVAPGRYDASLDVKLPDTVEVSLYHELSDTFAVHADVLWTNWSQFDSLAPQVQGTGADAFVNATSLTNEDWEDTFRYSIGATWKAREDLTLRAGLAYDESPVGDENRTLRIPDGDRFWVSLGFTYHLSESYNLDFGYTHIFADPNQIDANESFFTGEAEGDVDLVSIGLSGSF